MIFFAKPWQQTAWHKGIELRSRTYLYSLDQAVMTKTSNQVIQHFVHKFNGLLYETLKRLDNLHPSNMSKHFLAWNLI